MITKQMKQQPHMVMTALITIILAVFGSVQNAVGGVTPNYDSSTKTLTLKFDAAGDFASYSSQLTDEYKAASIVIFDGPELNDNDVNKINVFTNSVIDLRNVNKISTNTSSIAWGFNNWSLNSSVVFPNNTAISTLKSLSKASGTLTFVSAEGNKLNVATNHVVNMVKIGDFSNAFNYVKGSDGSINTIDLASSDLWDQSKSEGFFAPLDFVGVKNLVLENFSNCNILQDSFKGLKNIRRVVLPDNTDLTSYAYSSESSVEVYQTLKKISDTETVCQLNIVKPGGLAALKDAPYTSENIEKAYCFDIYGTANKADYGAMNSIDNPRLNLSQMTFDAKDFDNDSKKLDALDQIDNKHIKYLALPDAGDEVSDPLFNTLRNNMKDIIGIAYYCKDKKSYTCYTSQPGDVHILTEMTENVTKVNGKGNPNIDIDNLKISGNVNAKDISANTNTDVYYDENGHFAFTDNYNVSSADNYREMDKNAKGDRNGVAFDGSNGVKKLDLKDAIFSNINDLTLSETKLIGASSVTVVIPSSVDELPTDFLHVNGANNIKSIHIPYNITKIGYRAFYGLNNLNHITTTDKDGNLIDKGYGKKTELKEFTAEDGTKFSDQVVIDEVDSTAGSAVFSTNLKEIDTWAFASMIKVKDVYNLSTKAPVCQVNAFGTNPCTGNNGFSPNGGITRADFQNNGWIAVLHYPSSIQGMDEEKLYTDVTRDYTITDADGNADGKGNVIKWPNHSEFIRSYQQATNGYLWNAWDAPRTAWSNLGTFEINLKNGETSSGSYGYQMSQEIANTLFNNSAKKDKSAIFYHTSADGKSDVDNGDWQKTVYIGTNEQLYDNYYRGWHQFVLATSFNYEEPDVPSHNFSYINDNGWWTICVPFNMTRAEVRKIFGNRPDGEEPGKPHVCEFTGVLRDAEYTDNSNTELKGKIVLQFDRDVYTNVYKEDGKTVDRPTTDEDVVIKAGVPYLLQPDFKKKSDGSLEFYPAQQVLTDERCRAVSQVELRKGVKDGVVTVEATDKDGKGTGKYYKFIGNYWQTEMPRYAYFLAWYDKEQVATFFWQEEFPDQKLNWNAYTAIIGYEWKDGDDKIYVPQGKFGNVHWYTRHNNDDKTNQSVFTDDSFSTTGSAKANGPENVSIEAAGNTADGITKVHFGDRTIDIFHGKVFNLNGQYVGDSLEGLPKGIYIAAGKKYVVK